MYTVEDVLLHTRFSKPLKFVNKFYLIFDLAGKNYKTILQ